MLLIQIRKNINILLRNNGSENLKDLNAFIEYSKNMQVVCKNIEEYNPTQM